MTTQKSHSPNGTGTKISDPAQVSVVVYGTDDGEKPRAGLFKPSQAALAIKAAGLMKLKHLPVDTTAHLAAVEKVPAGRLYANGRGFVPYVRRDLYDKIVGLAVASPATKAPTNEPGSHSSAQSGTGSAGGEAPKSAGRPLPATWTEVGPGSLVLAQASLEDGWWEGIVISRTAADVLTLKWRDYPKFKPFTRHLATIALMNPAT